MICRKCGAQIPDNSAVCSFCGAEYEVAPVEEETSAAENAEQKEEALGVDALTDETDIMLDENEKNRLLQAERLNAEKQQQLDEIAQRRKQKKRRQVRNRTLVVLGIVAACGAIAAGVNHIKHRNDDVPEVVVVSHEPTQEVPEVVTTPEDGENPEGTAENGETATAAPANGNTTTASAGAGGTAWRSTGGAGSTGSSAAGLAPASGAGKTSSTTAASGSASKSSASGNAASSAKTAVSKSAYNGSSFKSALVTGGSVTSMGNGNYMSFSYGGNTYYAKVSADTTTEFVKDKPMTISAQKSGETYNGSSVYNITSITNYNGNYVFAESGYKLLTEADLAGKSAWELKVGRNEIYARHGRQFKEQALQAYFNSCAWYKPDPSYNTDNDSAYLNATELQNAYFILDYEKKHQ